MPHKHMQLIPLDSQEFSLAFHRVPLDAHVPMEKGVLKIKPFENIHHAAMRFPEPLSKDLTQESLKGRTDMVMNCYQQLLSHLDIKETDHLNTVITHDYILINTRKVAKIQDFYVNSMAYAGVMVVKSEDNFQ